MRRAIGLCVRLGLVVLALGMAAPASASAADMTPWLPAESYPGRRQADPRLDEVVDFWGAGLPLARVFEGIAEQTGVEIGFYPPGDMNERVCVDLYLNPDDPPTLRELLVQLSWVTDCAFACSPEEPRRYWLLSTSAGNGALVRTLEARERERDERNRAQHPIEAELRKETVDRLADLREALAVPEEDLVDTYLGVDDLLLLATLDPARRAHAEFLVSLSDDDLQELQLMQGLTRPWSGLAPFQREVLREAIDPCLQGWAVVSFGYFDDETEHWDDWEWVEPRLSDVELELTSSGSFNCYVMVPDPQGGGATGVSMPSLQLAFDPRLEECEDMRLYSEVELRRLLGEEVSEEEVESIQWDYWEEARRRRVREQVAEQLRRQHPLRRDNEDLLASLTLPVQTTRPYALWQLQELVAARAGLHVVSDCFWQPARSFDLALAKLYPEGAPDLNALAVLRAATLPTRGDVGGDLCDEKVSWEWGDAGDFLRFRDYHRDVCRDIFLSPEAVATLDGWIDAALPDDLAQGDNAAVEVALDPRQVGMVFLPLRPEQRRYGWHLIYDDPTDTRNAYRRAFREHLADVIPDERVYLLLARFSEGQWERLKTEGLTWGVDVLIEPDAHDLDLWFSTWYAYREGDEFRLREAREGEGRGWHWRVPVTSWLRFYVCREGYDPPDDLYDELALPRGVLVKPKSAARLTEAEECAIPPWVNHPALKELALPPYPGARPELIDRWRQERDGEPAVTQVVLLSPDRVDVVYDFYLHRLPRARGFPVHPRQLERPDDIAMGMVYGRPGDRRILHLYQSAEKKETKLTAHWLADCDAPPSERGE